MKRSEALKIIDDTYGEFCADWVKADLNDLEGFVALNERILSALEKAGLQPPNVTLDELLPKSGLSEVGDKHYYSCWEPENVQLEENSKFQDSLDKVNKKYGNALKKLGDD